MPQRREHSCQMDLSDLLPADMRLRVEILDEGGKLNLNMTRPNSIADINRWFDYSDEKRESGSTYAWATAIQRLLEAKGVDTVVAENMVNGLMEYWARAGRVSR